VAWLLFWTRAGICSGRRPYVISIFRSHGSSGTASLHCFDIGAGSSDMTWSAMTDLTRSFGWGDILFVYRHLEYDEDFDGLMQSFSFSGPALGASFRF